MLWEELFEWHTLQLDYAGERVFICSWGCNFYTLWMYSSKDSRVLAHWIRVVIMSVGCFNIRNYAWYLHSVFLCRCSWILAVISLYRDANRMGVCAMVRRPWPLGGALCVCLPGRTVQKDSWHWRWRYFYPPVTPLNCVAVDKAKHFTRLASAWTPLWAPQMSRVFVYGVQM